MLNRKYRKQKMKKLYMFFVIPKIWVKGFTTTFHQFKHKPLFSEEWLLTGPFFICFLRLLWWCRRRIFWQKRLRNPKDTPHLFSEFSFRTKPFFNSIQDHPNTSTCIISFVFYTFIYNSFLDLSVVQILLFMRLMFECIRILE